MTKHMSHTLSVIVMDVHFVNLECMPYLHNGHLFSPFQEDPYFTVFEFSFIFTLNITLQ